MKKWCNIVWCRFNSLNQPCFHCWKKPDRLRRVLLRRDILQGHQQRQWNSVDETACAEYSGHDDRSLRNIVPKQETLSDFLHSNWSYNPVKLNSGQNGQFFVLCDFEIWQMTMNKANLRDLIAATGLVILLKLDSKHRFFTPCHLKIKWMTPKNYRSPLLYFIKLCASFQIHQWIQTGVTARKRQFFWAVWPCNLTCDLEKQ